MKSAMLVRALIGRARLGHAFAAALAFALALALSAAPARAEENPVGEWDVRLNFNGNDRPGKVIITKAADGALAGKWSSQRGDSDLSNVKFDAGKLTFTRSMERQGQSFELNFEGAVEGDKLSGKFVTPQGEMPLVGARAGSEAAKSLSAVGDSGAPAAAAKPAGPPKPNLAGEWDIVSKSALGDLKRKLVIRAGNKGYYDTGEEKYTIKNLKQNGEEVTFDVTVSLEGNDLPLAFKGKSDGKTIAGEFTSDQGNAEVTGAKVGGAAAATPSTPAASAAPSIVGAWDVTSESQLGTLKRKLIVNPDLTGTYELDEGKFPIRDLKQEGDVVTYSVTLQMQGNELALSFKGKVEGDKLTGDYTSDVGDAKIVASRIK